MDKNFINIDDLVRQRLGGGEETERAGAWLQMRDLLDKEMPQKKGGFIYWRRIFSAIGVLALISTMSIGSYMFATSTKGSNTDANTGIDNNATTTNASPTPLNTNELNNTSQISSIDAAHTAVVTNNDHSNKQTNESKTGTLKQENKHLLASNQNSADHKTQHKNRNHGPAVNRQFLTQLIAANERSKQQVNNIATSSISEVNLHTNAVALKTNAIAPVAGKNSDNTENKLSAAKTYAANGNEPSGKQINSKNKKSPNKQQAVYNNTLLALNINPAAANTVHPVSGNNIRKAAANKNEKANMHQLALSSNTISTKNIAGVNANNIIAGNNKFNAEKNVSSGNNPTTGSPASINNTDKKTTNNNIIKKEVAAVKMGKKVIDRLVMTEHYVKTSPTEGYFKLDTISIESVSEELGLNNDPNQNPANNAARKTASSNTEENNDAATASTNSPILPSAATSVAGKSGMGLKENQAAKIGNGTSTVEKLSATFNDIKFHIAGAQFAPGLTAGINGTFFGPNSFKGFQFGVTGNFIFSDNLSLLAEVKYFHRINNNYSLNDNYYTYTPVGGGQYSKELQPVSYSFSTLHSIEMPISIRYCLSHFNFFVGGNLVYAFAINTGASTQVTTTNTPVLVSAPGNDNTPKIKANDFNSQFGLGYLLGISYQLSPNVMLDFRNVQTVWNNSSSQGAKIISNQLYKSPSLQVSIGYRLGGKKNKN